MYKDVFMEQLHTHSTISDNIRKYRKVAWDKGIRSVDLKINYAICAWKYLKKL